MVMLLCVQLEKELGEALGPDASVEERAHHVDDQLVHPQVLGQQRGEVPRAAAIPAARWAGLSGVRFAQAPVAWAGTHLSRATESVLYPMKV